MPQNFYANLYFVVGEFTLQRPRNSAAFYFASGVLAINLMRARAIDRLANSDRRSVGRRLISLQSGLRYESGSV